MKNKRLTKILSFVIAVALLFSTMTLGAVAADTPMIVASDVTGSVGQTVDVTISLQDNPGMVSMTLTVTYDSDKLELTAVTDSGLLSGKTHKPEMETPYTLAWANDTATENITVEGVIVTLSFKILDTAVVGENYAVEIYYDLDNWDIYDCNSEVVEFGIDIVLALLVLVIAMIGKGCSNNNTNTELVGVWKYDQYTEYEFKDGNSGCMCLDNNTHYEFTYSIKGNILYIDFALDYVTDCQYTYSLNSDNLTLVGGNGTAEVGKVYELTKLQ